VIPSLWGGHRRSGSMMGRRKSEQGQLFYAFDLEAIVPDDH
jgi:hypothetical protein